MIGELCSQSEMSFVKILDQGDVPFRDGSTIDLGEALFYFRAQLGYVSKLSSLTTGAEPTRACNERRARDDCSACPTGAFHSEF